MDLKKISRLHHEHSECRNRIERHKKALPLIEQEIREHFEELVDKAPAQGQEILLSRRRKSFQERLTREKDGIATSEVECSVLEKALLVEGKKVIDEIASALSREHADTVAEHDALKKRICNLQYQAQQLMPQLSKLDLQKETQMGVIKNFQRQYPPDRIIKLITHPDDPEFHGAGTVVRLIPAIQGEWQKAVDKRNKADAEIRAQSEKEKQARIKKNREYTDRALRITSGTEELPKELQPLYNNTSIELNVLVDYLKRQDQQAGRVKA